MFSFDGYGIIISMKKLVIASNNQHKINEIKAMLPQFEVVSQGDIGFDQDVEENGQTFEENALIKAKAIYDRFAVAVLADDSGICIDYFDGRPGIYSARYLGHDTPYTIKNQKILETMTDVPLEKRGAQFVCAMAYIDIHGQHHIVKGVLNGHINTIIEGENGFGYDPIFVPDGFDHSIAMLSEQEKNKISHRHQALEKMVGIIETDLD